MVTNNNLILSIALIAKYIYNKSQELPSTQINQENRMSRSIKHEKTHGFLDNISKLRKFRKEIRANKTQMLNDIETLTGKAFIPAQEY